MKRTIITIIAICATLLCGGNAMAQKAKFGHIDYAAIIQAQPETTAAEEQVRALKTELENDGEQLQNEFQTKYQEFQQKQATYSAAVAKVKQQELEDMYKRLQDFVESAEVQLQTKQQELLTPIKDKVLAAVAEVAKAGGYTYIFDVTTPLFSSDSEDITELVKAKLAK